MPLIWPGEVKPRHVLGLERGLEVARVEEVVLDRVAGPRQVRALEAADAAHEGLLHVERQAGRDAVRVHLVRVESLGLDEDLVRGLVGEARHLVFDRGAVARADALDHAGEHAASGRCAARMISCVRSLVAVMWQGTCRGCSLAQPEEGEHRHGLVARLHLQSGVVDAAAVDARRRAGLEPADAQRQRAQLLGEPVRRRVAGPAARVLLEPDVDAAAEEGADREHHGARAEFDARLRDHARHPAALEAQVGDFLLEQRQVRLVLEHAADGALVELPVGLGARRPHRRALAGVQRAELDAGAIDRTRHRAAERVDFLHEVALADAADRRIAAHLAQRLDALRHEQRAAAQPGRGQRGLGAGVAAAHHDDVERVHAAPGTAWGCSAVRRAFYGLPAGGP